MKKTMTLIMAMMLVLGFASMASAIDVDDTWGTCSDPGRIVAGCTKLQGDCLTFDYEEHEGYCASKGWPYKALINICECDFTDHPQGGDTIDISMEILVDKGTGTKVKGDNGVYWAENVQTIGLNIYNRIGFDVCNPNGWNAKGTQWGQSKASTVADFDGPFYYRDKDGKDVTSFSNCASRAVKIDYDVAKTKGGHFIPRETAIANDCWYQPNIPSMWVDPDKADINWKVYVRICLWLTEVNQDAQGAPIIEVCPTPCCYDFYVGTLCCLFETSCMYPYVAPLAGTYWDNSGLTVTNLTGDAGKVTITVYEEDGDVGSWTEDMAAYEVFSIMLDDLAAALTKTSGSGTLGDAQCQIDVTSSGISISGLVVMSNSDNGETLSYLPHCR